MDETAPLISKRHDAVRSYEASMCRDFQSHRQQTKDRSGVSAFEIVLIVLNFKNIHNFVHGRAVFIVNRPMLHVVLDEEGLF